MTEELAHLVYISMSLLDEKRAERLAESVKCGVFDFCSSVVIPKFVRHSESISTSLRVQDISVSSILFSTVTVIISPTI